MKSKDEVTKLAEASINAAEVHLRMYLDSLAPADGMEMAVMLQMITLKASLLLAATGGIEAANYMLERVKEQTKMVMER